MGTVITSMATDGFRDEVADWSLQTDLSKEDIVQLDGEIEDLRPGVSGVLPFSHGGTGGDTRKDAIYNLTWLGTNIIDSVDNDTVANWSALGTGYGWYNVASLITNQPSQYGFIINITIGGSGQDLFQIWKTQNSGALYMRSGNSSGWGLNWAMLPHNRTNFNPATAFGTSLGATTLPFNSMIAKGFYIRDNNLIETGKFCISSDGTADAQGECWIMLGNATATGTAGNSRGRIRLYDNTTYYTNIVTHGTMTANRTVTLPNASGTVAFTSGAATDYTTARYRNIYAGTGGMTASSTALSNGYIYMQYT